MQTFMVAVCLLSGVAAIAESRESHCSVLLSANFPDHQDTEKYCPLLRDLIVLKDGTKLYGTIIHFPTLHFPFGDVSFDGEEVGILSISQDGPQLKMQVETRDGLVFKGSIEGETILFAENSLLKEILPETIQQAYLSQSDGTTQLHGLEKRFIIEFKDGNLISVSLPEGAIHLSDGWKDFDLHPDQILQLFFNGGLTGTIRRQNGNVKELHFSFAKEKYLPVRLANQNHNVKVPWTSVAMLQTIDRNELREGQFLQVSQASSDLKMQGLALQANRLISQMPIFAVQARSLKDKIQGPDIRVQPVLSRILDSSFGNTIWNHEIEDELVSLTEDFEQFDKNYSEDLNQELADVRRFLAELDLRQRLQDEALEERKSAKEELKAEQKRSVVSLNPVLPQNQLADVDLGGDGDEDDEFYLDEDYVEHMLVSLADKENHIEVGLIQQDNQNSTVGPLFIAEGNKTNGPYIHPILDNKFAGMVLVTSTGAGEASFYIDEQMVSNEDYSRFVKAVNYHTPSDWIDGKIPFGQETQPVVNVSYTDALVYAVWLGKRLPTAKEYNQAKEKGSLRFGSNNMINEWTSTSYVAKTFQTRGSGENFKLIEGNTQKSTPMRIEEFNLSTGFRCVVSFVK